MRPALALLVSSVGLVWYAALMRPVLAAAALGPVCHHGGTLALHCPACYAALAMVGGGLAALITGSARSLAPIPARRAA